VGHHALPTDGPAGPGRGHRQAALLLAPAGARSKTNPTHQPSKMLTKNESAKDFGHYRILFLNSDLFDSVRMRAMRFQMPKT